MRACRAAGPLLLVAVLLATVVPAWAQEATLDVAVRDSSFEIDGSSQITVTVGGSAKPDVLEPGAFSVTENGEPVDELDVEPLLELADTDIVAALLLDTSTSMAGELLESIKTASIELAETVTGEGIPLALLEFNSLTTVLSEPTTDADALRAEIEPLEATGGTALYDAIIVGTEQLADVDGVTSLIVLADGEDTVSDATLDEALAAAQSENVPITVIAYETELFEPDVLRPLADETDGRFITADDIDQFDEIFAEVAADVASQYRITYASQAVDADELDIEVAVSAGGVDADHGFVVPNTRDEAAVSGPAAPPPAALADPGPFATDTALWISVGAGFVGLLLFLLLLLVPRGDRAASRTLQRGLTITERRAGPREARGTGLSASAIGQRALDAISSVPKPAGFEERTQLELDRAGWQLRTSEYIALRIAGLLVGLAFPWALTGSLLLGVVGAVIGLYLPAIMLLNAKRRRFNAFMEQLPDTLQLLGGTLKAGYGVLQGLDTIVKETQPPVSTEFRRVLTEARLGMPLEDSLESMAERIDSDDFRWVVVAINIQRQVGGNLAELLETVSETLRGREQTRRQIQVLSAEGRLSAGILLALPFVLLLYLLVANPGYLTPLITNPIGWIMAGGAVLLMVFGSIWMRRMIKIDV